MAIVPYSEMVNDVQVEVLKAPFPLIVRNIRNAAIEFYTKSEAMVYNHDPVTLVEGVSLYELDPMDQTRIGKILTVKYNGKKLTPTSRELLNQEIRDWETREAQPARFFLERMNEMRLAPVPHLTEPLAVKLSVSLVPTRTSTGVDDKYYEEHYQGILHGALRNLFMMNHQEWADPRRAEAEGFAFGQSVMEAKERAKQNNTAKPRLMKYGGY